MATKLISRLGAQEINKLESVYLFRDLVNVVAEFNPELLNIKEGVDDLLNFQPELEKIKVKVEKIPEVMEFWTVRKELHLDFRMINLTLDKMNLNNDTLLNSLELNNLTLFLRNQLKGLSNENMKDFVEKLIIFADTISTNTEMQALIEKAGMTTLLNSVKSIIIRLKALSESKGMKMALKEKAQTTEIKKKMVNLVHNLIIKIELLSDRNNASDYLPIISALNNLINSYRARKKAAITRAQNQQLAQLKSAENETTAVSPAKTTTAAV